MGGITNGTGLTVMDALELARDSPEGAQDPEVVRTLEIAIAYIWDKVQAQPTTYVMSRDEFAIFNYFQNRFEGNDIAASARRRYWNQ